MTNQVRILKAQLGDAVYQVHEARTLTYEDAAVHHELDYEKANARRDIAKAKEDVYQVGKAPAILFV